MLSIDAQVCLGAAEVPPIIFVGNKKDLTDSNPQYRAVSPEDIARVIKACDETSSRIAAQFNNGVAEEKCPDGWPILHFEASALSGERIDEMFEVLVREIKDRKKRIAVTEKKKKSSWYKNWCSIL